MGNAFSSIYPEVMEEMRQKSRKRIYQTDFDAWSSDVLGRRYYEKIRQISDDVVNGKKIRTAVKSSNGAGKSFWLSDIVVFWVTVFPPEEAIAIISAPTLYQIENVIFRYLKNTYGQVKLQAEKDNLPFAFPGWISEDLQWKYAVPGVGNQPLVLGKRPSDSDVISSFQGVRKKRSLIALDEGGGVPADLYTAAEAIATGQESRIVTIGNPDQRGTEFHRIFTQPAMAREWNLHSISAYELPTMTGEVVYPGEPEKQRLMLKGLTSRDWIEHKERVWGDKLADGTIRWDARGLAKVLGEFPGETDNTFFPQTAIDRSHENEIDDPESPVILGVDLAAGGSDESVVYVNRGGKVRVFDKEIHYDDGGTDRTTSGVWSKEDEVTSARRVHAIAEYAGAHEVRVDSAGLGGGVFAMLERLDEFETAEYELIAINGANQSTDKDRWANRRAENHDSLRRQMVDGLIDIDPGDTVLRDELLALTYYLNNRGAVQITPKKDMKSVMGGSPDRLDAVIYATVGTEGLFGPQPGSVLSADLDEFVDQTSSYYSTLPNFGW